MGGKNYGELTNAKYMLVKCPCMGLGFLYVNPPVLAPIVPGRGVVGHYVDRCIISNRVLHDRVDFR